MAKADIIGVLIKPINRFEDNRGWLSEIYRSDEDKLKPLMGYVSFTKFNVVRGPHEHKKQSDYFVFTGPGDFELYLWDNRKKSKTFRRTMKLTLGESNKVAVLVPPGVVHGYRSISKEGSYSVNLPDKLYKGKGKKQEVDEIRHENDLGSEFKISS